MWRAAAPYLTLAVLIVAAAMSAYDEGAPAWLVYVAILVACLVTLPVEAQWERRRRQRSGE